MIVSSFSTTHTLIAMYRQMQDAMVAADTRRLRSLLADDFILVHMTGYPQPRDEWLAQIHTGRMRYFSSVEEDARVTHVDAARASLRGRNRVRADIWGVEGLWPLQLDIELSHIDGAWFMRHAGASTY